MLPPLQPTSVTSQLHGPNGLRLGFWKRPSFWVRLLFSRLNHLCISVIKVNMWRNTFAARTYVNERNYQRLRCSVRRRKEHTIDQVGCQVVWIVFDQNSIDSRGPMRLFANRSWVSRGTQRPPRVVTVWKPCLCPAPARRFVRSFHRNQPSLETSTHSVCCTAIRQ